MKNNLVLEPFVIEDYAEFPDLFMSSFCIIKGINGLISFEPWPVQQEILRQISENNHIVFEKYNLSGFTTLMCGYVLWYLFTHKNDTVYFVAENQFMVNKIFELIRLMSVNIKSELRFGSANILHKKNNTMVKLLHKMPLLDGDLLIVDEADFVKSSNLEIAPKYFTKSIMYSEVHRDKDLDTSFRRVLKSCFTDGRFKKGLILEEKNSES